MRSSRGLLLLQTLLYLGLGCTRSPSTPEERHLQVVRARALFEAGDGKGAEALLRHVVEADPKPDAQANLGWVQWSRGRRKQAAESWQAALDLDPTHERALYSLAALRLRELTERGVDPRADAEAWQEVRVLSERASQAGAHNASIQRLLATVATTMGDTAAAVAAQREAERLDPGRAGTAPEVYGLEGIRLPRLRRASQTMRTPPRFTRVLAAQTATSVLPIDLDGNGRLDLILGGSPIVSWSDADAEGSQIRWQQAALLETPISLVCPGYFDADAAVDLVVFSQTADSLAPHSRSGKGATHPDTRVWLIRGGSRRPQKTWLFNLAPEVRAAQALDADWDGDLDVVIAMSEAPGLQLLRNAGGGRFNAPVAVPGCSEFGPARSVVAADVDGDGRDDLVCLDANARVRVFAARASGVFANASARSGLAGQRARVLEAADLDDDGHVDLLLGDDEGLWVWANEGAGRFVRAAAYRDALAGWTARHERGIPVAAIHLADLDNDGLPDVVTQHFASPPPVFAVVSDATEGTEDTAPGGRRLDPLLAVPSWTRLAIWHNEDNMLFADVTAASGCGEGLVGAAPLKSGDFDGDGAVDLVAPGADSSLLFFWSRGGTVHRRLELELLDATRPASCVGARIELHTGTRTIYHTMRSPVAFLGILDAEVAEFLRVVWPDGSVENHLDVALPEQGRLRLTRGR